MAKADFIDVEAVRRGFPALSREMNGHPLVYLDNAATTQKPVSVIDRMDHFYRHEYATVHRGVYQISQQATWECDQVRDKCRRFLAARSSNEIVFVRGATEAINLVAASYGRKFLKKGDEIIISAIEHHANIVPWQSLCLEKELKLHVIPVNEQGELLLDEYKKLLSDRTRLVAVTHMSNALGTINPIKQMIELAHAAGAVVLIDGAQGVVHEKVDVQDLDCDFYCFSGHKLYGPTGIGVLYGKKKHLEAMDPYQTGGDMIETVTFDQTTFAEPPSKFEAGTPAIVEIIGLGSAIDYVQKLGLQNIAAYEKELLLYGTEKLLALGGIRIIGTAPEKASVISFVMEHVHPHDIGTILDQQGIAVRTGQHCAQPLMIRYGLSSTARASLAFYNTREEFDRLASGLKKVQEVFA